MADKTIRSLLVRLGVNADDKAVAKFDKGVDGVKKRMFAAVAAVGLLGGAIGKMVLDFGKSGDTVAKEAKRVRITAEEYQELGYAMQRAGGSQSDVSKALKRQAKIVLDLSRGLSTATDAADELGIKYSDIQGMGSVELFETMATKMRGVTDETTQMALAQDIWGRAGLNLLPLINDETTSIAQLREEARALGFIISNEAAASAEEFTDRMLDAKMIVQGLRNVIGESLLPIFTRMLTSFRDWFILNKQLIQQKLETWAEKLGKGIEKAGEFLKKVNAFVEDNLGGWGRVLKVVAAVAALMGSAYMLLPFFQIAAACVTIGGAIGAWPITLILVGLAAILLWLGFVILAIDDIRHYLDGTNSVLGETIDWLKMAWQWLKDSATTLDAMLTLAAGLDSPLGTAAGWVLAIKDAFMAMWPYVEKVSSAFQKTFQKPISAKTQAGGGVEATPERAFHQMLATASFQPGLARDIQQGGSMRGGDRQVSIGDTNVTVHVPAGAGASDAQVIAKAIAAELATRDRQAYNKFRGSER